MTIKPELRRFRFQQSHGKFTAPIEPRGVPEYCGARAISIIADGSHHVHHGELNVTGFGTFQEEWPSEVVETPGPEAILSVVNINKACFLGSFRIVVSHQVPLSTYGGHVLVVPSTRVKSNLLSTHASAVAHTIASTRLPLLLYSALNLSQ